MDTLASQDTSLTSEETRRYGRHLTLPEVGLAGQTALKRARVLLVGAGGLGSPVGMYLAAAGVGTLGVVDFDRVEVSNLQRQVLYGEEDLGRPKVEAACERLRSINPHIDVVGHALRFDAENAADLLAGYDLVVDGSDNFPTRYLVNDACVLAGKPNVWGAVLRFEGQVSVFAATDGPCYRCLFPEPPPPGLIPSCAEGGVLGVLPGLVGSLQANEVIKLIIGAGRSLIGRLLTIDALTVRFRELRLPPSADCPACGERPTIHQLGEYAAVCNPPPDRGNERGEGEMPEAATDLPFEIDVEQLADWQREGRQMVLLDVREPMETDICRIQGAVLIPMAQIPERQTELSKELPVVVYCHHGPRSSQVVGYLRSQGFAATNLAGGIDAWSLQIDPQVPRY